MLDDVPPYIERFKDAMLTAIAAKQEAPTEAPSSYPFTDQDRKRLEFCKWLIAHGRLSDDCPE